MDTSSTPTNVAVSDVLGQEGLWCSGIRYRLVRQDEVQDEVIERRALLLRQCECLMLAQHRRMEMLRARTFVTPCTPYSRRAEIPS